ncbi:MAG: hypothetical protein DRP78_07420 [Candidatus Omnitrophota bacterium]|nr:MAG: hypothetical protein DRP78_07420 [Candidatus Omnitrophota bacterium]
MTRRVSAAKKTEPREFVPPEIEVISKPEVDINLFAEQTPQYSVLTSVSPAEVLPSVGRDAGTSKKYRIVDIQVALNNAGFSPGPIDKKMGAKTKKAIREFQKVNKLAVDGIVGEKTWAKLKRYLNTQ